MRKIRVGMGVVAMLAAACTAAAGSDGPEGAKKPSTATVLVRMAGGYAAVDDGGERIAAWVADAEAAPDGSVLYRMDGRRLEMVDPAGGRAARGVEIGEGMVVRVVGPGGRKVVVMPDREASDPYRPEGRARTEISVVDTPTGGVKKHLLDGNYEPEALSTDGGSLFVIEYNPPLAPDRYRVRRLDLSTGEILDVFSPDKDLQEDMRGTARTQVMAPDGKRLYTLYTLVSDHQGGEPIAFVHVLDLEGLWAHCVDLPAPVGRASETAVGLALDADASRLFAVDRSGGAVAEVDTVGLAPVRVVDRAELALDDGAPVVAVAGGRVYVAGARRVHVLDAAALEPAEDAWAAPGAVDALRAADGGRLLLAATGGGVAVIDTETGTVRRTLELPGPAGKRSAPASSGLLDPARATIQCAC